MDPLDRLSAKKAAVANRMSEVGHHSPEARAVQTFMRALDGWCRAGLGTAAALVLAHQGVEDWLRTRLGKSEWEPDTFTGLLSVGIERRLIDAREAYRLNLLHQAWRRVRATGRGPAAPRLAAFLFRLIEFIERRW